MWLNAIYGVDLAALGYEPPYAADLKGVAHSIMAAHAFEHPGL